MALCRSGWSFEGTKESHDFARRLAGFGHIYLRVLLRFQFAKRLVR
jgi:hypothetical protein